MNCKQCGFEIQDGISTCPRCGTAQAEQNDNVSGVSMELPGFTNEDTVKEEKITKDATQNQDKKDVKQKVKETSTKAQEGIKSATKKVAKASKDAVKSVNTTIETAKADNSKNKLWLYVAIIVAAIALVFIIYGLISYDGGNDEDKYVLLASSDEEIFIVNGDKLTPLAEFDSKEVRASDIIIAKDASSFYVINDAEMDEDNGSEIGALVLLKSNGKETDIDDDVIAGSMKIVGDILWYLKADKEDTIVCCYDGRKAMEVIDEENLDTWIGTDKAGEAYYSLADPDNWTYETFFASDGDSDSIAEDSFLLTVSSDFKKVLMVAMEEDSDENTVFIFDGKKEIEVMDDVHDILVDPDTFNIAVIADAEDNQLYYVPYNKEPIEIDDEVDYLVEMPYLGNSNEGEIGDYIFYIKDNDLYYADIKGKDNDRIVKSAEDVEIIYNDKFENEMVYVDDDEVVRFNYTNMKELTIKLPDANDLSSYQVEIYDNWYVYLTEDEKELFAYNGRRDPIEIFGDGEDISSFAIMEGGKYIIWKTYDDELMVSPFKEKSEEEIGDDVYSYWTLENGAVYFISDYDYDDGVGDLYYTSRIGKDADEIEKNITTIFKLFYE